MRSRLTVFALSLCALVAAGCAEWRCPRIDPTGERVFVPQPPPANAPPARFLDEPGGQLPSDAVAVTLRPGDTVAPVGSEVVLVAGVRGPDRYLRTNSRLEWSLAAGSVGQFVQVGGGGFIDWLQGDSPRKVDSAYAVGATSRFPLRLHRGTPTPVDDVYVRDGEGWITVTSPVEGSSHVTVFAPEVYPWDARKQSATIHWIDAQCRFPPLAINPAGSKHTFTTTVMRQSNQCPHAGWRVRYQIAGGPAAGFAPDGAQAVEVVTDQAGQASVEIFQKQPAPGVNRICIQVIRPAGAAGDSPQVVFSGSTTKTWTAPSLAVRKTGPAVAGVGATLTYRTEVSNPGDQPARDVLVTEEVPAGVALLSSNPRAEVVGRRLQWRLGTLGPYERRLIEVSYRTERPGTVTACVEAVAFGGLKASHCATTTIATGPTGTGGAAGPLGVTTTGPREAAVGSQVTFEVLITNRSPSPMTNLAIRDDFDPGLEHKEGKSPIQRPLGTLAPGQSLAVHVVFRVAKAGRLCHRVEVTGAGGIRATAEACVTAGEPGVQPPTGPKRLSVSVKRLGPQEQDVGDTAKFTIEVTNHTDRALKSVSLVAGYDSSLRPTMATSGNKPEGSSLVWVIDLPVGKPMELEMHCRCLSVAAKACVRVTASTPDGARAADEACVEIREGTGGTGPEGVTGGALAMTVSDLHDPIKVGETETYEIRVMNQGRAADKLVTVEVTVPDGMTPMPMGTTGPPGTTPTISRQTVSFSAAEQIRPGETLLYRVRALARQPGQVRLRAEVTSIGQPRPQIKEETTEIID